MQHNEHDPRHPHHWEHLRHRHERQHRHPEHFNDFGSRWGEPTPQINLHHPGYEWEPREHDRFEQRGRYHREEWLPEQRHNRRPPQHFHGREEHEMHRPPVYRQRDVHFDPSNQRVEDRWYEDPSMPHPHQRPSRHYDSFWQDYEDER